MLLRAEQPTQRNCAYQQKASGATARSSGGAAWWSRGRSRTGSGELRARTIGFLEFLVSASPTCATVIWAGRDLRHAVLRELQLKYQDSEIAVTNGIESGW